MAAHDHLEVYPDTGSCFRWRLVARNGRIVAVSGESFASKRNATRAARRVFPNADIR